MLVRCENTNGPPKKESPVLIWDLALFSGCWSLPL